MCILYAIYNHAVHTHFNSFYGLDDTESSTLNTYLSKLIQRCVNELLNAYCIEFDEVIM